MSLFSFFKIGNTTYDVADAAAREITDDVISSSASTKIYYIPIFRIAIVSLIGVSAGSMTIDGTPVGVIGMTLSNGKKVIPDRAFNFLGRATISGSNTVCLMNVGYQHYIKILNINGGTVSSAQGCYCQFVFRCTLQ